MKRTILYAILFLLILLPCRFSAQEKQSNGLFAIIQNEKRGFIDRTGKVIIVPQFDGAGKFSEGLAAVSFDGSNGFIDVTGKMVITPQFYSATYFSEGLAAVSIDMGIDEDCPGCRHKELWGYVDGKWQFIDKAGNIVITTPFDLVGDFEGGLAAVQEGFGYGSTKHGFIDKSGKVVWSPSN